MSELNLRQARNLEARLRNQSINNQVIEIRAYDIEVARKDLSQGVAALGEEIDNKLELNSIRHKIKHKLNTSNMEHGVSELLNTRDRLYSERDILNTLKESDDYERQLRYIKEHPKDRRIVSVYTPDIERIVQDDLDDISESLREIALKLKDINESVTIDIEEEDCEVLKANGLM